MYWRNISYADSTPLTLYYMYQIRYLIATTWLHDNYN